MQGLPKQIFGFMEIRAKSFCRFIIFPFKTSFVDLHHFTSDILQDFLDRRSPIFSCRHQSNLNLLRKRISIKKGKRPMADILAEINKNATMQ
jgi:hypothetical protein